MFSILYHIGFDGIVSMITYGKAALTGFGQWEVHAWQIEWQQSGHYAGMYIPRFSALELVSLHPLSLMASMPFFILTIPSRVYSPSEEQLLPISLLNSGLEGVLLPPHP